MMKSKLHSVEEGCLAKWGAVPPGRARSRKSDFAKLSRSMNVTDRYSEAIVAIERLRWVGSERTTAEIDQNWSRVDELIQEGRQLRNEIEEFISSLDWLDKAGY